ncbi:pre-mRNA-splicing factor srp2 [Agrilus planipennis]|uniref:Pre-mRNA-splicing factor srp2 n=1 Tax=Agrilus planipennis TaxID=224129 RepID=A0A1W4WJG1_AGRPL|nr:pre-mRNA-splicing factor srp2 [Agrilus planipennis]
MYRTDKQFMKNPATTPSRIFIGNLGEGLIPLDLEEKFKIHGNILGLVLQRGFAFVQYEKESEAHSAIEKENGCMFRGRKLTVKQAFDKKNHQKPPFRQQQQHQQQQNQQTNQQNQRQKQDRGGLLPTPILRDNPSDKQIESHQDNNEALIKQEPDISPSIDNQGREEGNDTAPGEDFSEDNFSLNKFIAHDPDENHYQQDNQVPQENEEDAYSHNRFKPKEQVDDSYSHNKFASSEIDNESYPHNKSDNDSYSPKKFRDDPHKKFSGRERGTNDDSYPHNKFLPADREEDKYAHNKFTVRDRDDDTQSVNRKNEPTDSYVPPAKRGRGRKTFNQDNFRDGPRSKFYGREEPYPPQPYVPPPAVEVPLPPERNDCEIIVVSKLLTEYAEFIEQRLKNLGLIVDLLFPNEDVPLGRVLASISSRGCLYAILVMPQNEENRSLTLNILHGLPQEHRNMPIEDALKLISRNFEAYMRGDKTNRANGTSMSLEDRHPEQIQVLFNLLAENRQLTTLQYDKILKYLEERKELQSQYENKEGIEKTIEPAVNNKAAELQNRILNILNKSGQNESPKPVGAPVETEAVTPTPLLNDPSVQKALDSLLSGEMFKGSF